MDIFKWFRRKQEPEWRAHEGPVVLNVPVSESSVASPATISSDTENQHPAEVAKTNLSVCPEHANPVVHHLLHDPGGLCWFEQFPEPNTELRMRLVAGTFPDAYFEKVNDRFKYFCLAKWGKESTADDIRYAFEQVRIGKIVTMGGL